MNKSIIKILFILHSLILSFTGMSTDMSSNASEWKAYGGELDILFIYKKLDSMKIKVSPEPKTLDDDWSKNHMVFKFNPINRINIQAPLGNIQAITSGSLKAHTDFTLEYQKNRLNILELNFVPVETKGDYDIFTFKVFDQNQTHLFTTDSIHIRYDLHSKLLKMDNMDLIASPQLAKALGHPSLASQVIAQLNLFNRLSFPNDFDPSLKTENCLTNPNWRDGDEVIDVSLVSIPTIDWKLTLASSNELVITPSAELFNSGTADVPWYVKFTGNFPPYNNDQHPYLVWNTYREIDNRFEQIGTSGIKHAYFSTNVLCDCPGGNVLGVGCGDVYSSTDNDRSNALGPRNEVEVFTGLWQGCGSFFDPLCTGSQTNSSSGLGENRLKLPIDKIVPNLVMSAWYIIREDINIFNSMGYKAFSPTENNGSWIMNPQTSFTNGPAIYSYVPANTLSPMQASQTIKTNKGHLTVAVKVVDLGNGQFRYNYAVENHDYDPKIDSYSFALEDFSSSSDFVFVDTDSNVNNNWAFSHQNQQLKIENPSTNPQPWGSLFSFSITINSPPMSGQITLQSNETSSTIQASVLVPLSNDLIFLNSFDLSD